MTEECKLLENDPCNCELPRDESEKKFKQSTAKVVLFYYYYFFNIFIFIFILLTRRKGSAIHRASNYPNLLVEMPRYCCPLEILIEI